MPNPSHSPFLPAPPTIAQSDYEQAKRELTGESDGERQLAAMNA